MTTWRDSITVHPTADRFRMMPDGELKELAADIGMHGQREPVLFTIVDGKEVLIDGRNRLAACFLIKREPTSEVVKFEDAAAIESFIVSRNIYRRHLTSDDRVAILRDLIKASPETSDRELARKLKVDHKTIGKARSKLESTGDVLPSSKRKGKDGKTRKLPAKKVVTKDEAQDTCNTLAADFSAAIDGATPLTSEASAEERKAQYAALDTTEADTPVEIGAMPLVPAASPIVETNPEWLQLSIAAEPADMAPKILEAIGAAKAAAPALGRAPAAACCRQKLCRSRRGSRSRDPIGRRSAQGASAGDKAPGGKSLCTSGRARDRRLCAGELADQRWGYTDRQAARGPQ
jgi:hypothetical protein